MARQALIAIVALCCFMSAALGQALQFPTLSGWVVDQAGVLNAQDQALIANALRQLDRVNGDQFVVVTVGSLQGQPIETYARQLGNSWALGDKDKNNGALLIVAPKERAVRIEVGTGLQATLTSSMAQGIIDKSILPWFRKGDLPAGIKEGTREILLALGGTAPGLPELKWEAGPAWLAYVWLPHWGLILGVVLVLLFGIGGSWRRWWFGDFWGSPASNNSSSGSGSNSSPPTAGGGDFGGGGASGSW